MSTCLGRRARLLFAAFVGGSVALFVVLGALFGGPSLPRGGTERVTIALPDAQGLPTGADVLVRGVGVGKVGRLETTGARTAVELVLEPEAPPLRADASVRVAGKTPLGEAYVQLDPGRDGRRLAAGAAPAVRDAVQIDDALATLGDRSRADVRALLDVSAAALDGDAAVDVSSTVVGLERATRELRALTDTLAGQDDDVAATVLAARDLLDELGRHDAALRGIVADGSAVLATTGYRPAALRAALQRLPGVLTATRTTLAAARPLLREARPAVADVRAATPALRQALDGAVRPLRDARAVSRRLPELRRAGGPALTAAAGLLREGEPALRQLGPVLANAAPMGAYLAPRTDTIAAWFANTDALGRNRDAKGHYARFFVGFDPATALGLPGAPAGNSYTRPGDAAENRAYVPGDFPRLRATPRP